MGESWNC